MTLFRTLLYGLCCYAAGLFTGLELIGVGR
jgi:hypothetical protein